MRRGHSQPNLVCIILPHRKAHLGEEEFAVEQVRELNQALLHRGPATGGDVKVPPQRRLAVTREENPLRVFAIIQEWDPRAHEITGHIHHLSHQICT